MRKDEGQKVAIPFPQRQLKQTVPFDPFECPFGIFRPRLTAPGINPEDKTEPVFPVLAETRPADRAPQSQLNTFEAGLLAHFPSQPRDHVFARVQLAAQAVVLAEMGVLGPSIAVNKQNLSAVRRQEVTEGSKDRRVRHRILHSATS